MEKMAALVFRFIVFTAEIPRPHGRWPHPVARCRLGHFRITPELGLRGAVAGGHTGLYLNTTTARHTNTNDSLVYI